MRNHCSVVVLSLLAFAVCAATAVQAEDPLNILFIGNSFTYTGDVPTLVKNMATSAGWTAPNVASSTPGGTTLEYHRTNTTTLSLVDQGDWDFVVLQEYSTRPVDNPAAANANPVRFEQDAAWFYDRIKQNSPAAKVVMYETWARHESNTGFYPSLFPNRDTMQSQLNYWYHDAVENYIPTHVTSAVKNDVLLAPAGEAWALDYHGENYQLFGGDLYHPNNAGAYLNGAVLYSTMYNRSAQGLANLGNSATMAAYLRTIADQATGKTIQGGPTGPELVYTKVDLGDGKVGYTFAISNDDGLQKSYAVTLGFQGAGGATIQQSKIMGVMDVNDEATATTWNGQGTPPYYKAQDSWVAAAFTSPIPGANPLTGTPVNGIAEGPNSYVVSFGTGANSLYGDGVAVAYIVADGDVQWTGSISRDSRIYQTTGVTPEPASLAMLVLGAAALLRRRTA